MEQRSFYTLSTDDNIANDFDILLSQLATLREQVEVMRQTQARLIAERDAARDEVAQLRAELKHETH